MLLDAWDDLAVPGEEVQQADTVNWLAMSDEQLNSEVLQEVVEDLRSCAVEARVGRDILDPFEAVGWVVGLGMFF